MDQAKSVNVGFFDIGYAFVCVCVCNLCLHYVHICLYVCMYIYTHTLISGSINESGGYRPCGPGHAGECGLL